jgi:hypothetical protein
MTKNIVQIDATTHLLVDPEAGLQVATPNPIAM